MRIFAVDPGPNMSAFVLWNTEEQRIENKGLVKNEAVEVLISQGDFDMLAIEMIASYGMPVGQSVFWTCVAIGSFAKCLSIYPPHKLKFVYRKDVKLHFCGAVKAKDAHISQVLKDLLEPGLKPREKPKGVLKGVKKDEWQALAIAIYTESLEKQK